MDKKSPNIKKVTKEKRNSHPGVFCEIAFLIISENSQENSCAEAFFLCNFNKRLCHRWFPVNLAKLVWRQNWPDVKANVCKSFLRKYVQVLCILNQTYCNKKTYLLHMLQSFCNVIKDQKFYCSNPIYRTFD